METPVPAPSPTPDSQEFWTSLRDHVLRLPYCSSCESYFFPPMPGCPGCGAGESSVRMRPASGRGHVNSWFVAHHAFDPAFADDVPYVVLDVNLAEGPRVNGRLLGCAKEDVTPGMEVRACFEDLPGFTRLAFTAAGDGALSARAAPGAR